MPLHRVTLTDQHYDMVRRFMVGWKLPSARSATEKMIELVSERDGAEGMSNGGGEVEREQRAGRPLLSRPRA